MTRKGVVGMCKDLILVGRERAQSLPSFMRVKKGNHWLTLRGTSGVTRQTLTETTRTPSRAG